MLTDLLDRQSVPRGARAGAPPGAPRALSTRAARDRLDRLTWLNARIGIVAADGVLLELANRLRSVTHRLDYAFRLGGGRFAIVRPGSEGETRRSSTRRSATSSLRTRSPTRARFPCLVGSRSSRCATTWTRSSPGPRRRSRRRSTSTRIGRRLRRRRGSPEGQWNAPRDRPGRRRPRRLMLPGRKVDTRTREPRPCPHRSRRRGARSERDPRRRVTPPARCPRAAPTRGAHRGGRAYRPRGRVARRANDALVARPRRRSATVPGSAPLVVDDLAGRTGLLQELALDVAGAHSQGDRLAAAVVRSEDGDAATLARDARSVADVPVYTVGPRAVALVLPGLGRADALGVLARIETRCPSSGRAVELESGEDPVELAARLLGGQAPQDA